VIKLERLFHVVVSLEVSDHQGVVQSQLLIGNPLAVPVGHVVSLDEKHTHLGSFETLGIGGSVGGPSPGQYLFSFSGQRATARTDPLPFRNCLHRRILW